MESRLGDVLTLGTLAVAVFFLVMLVNAIRLRAAESRYRAGIEAFFAWFEETTRSRDAIEDIGWSDQRAAAFVYPKKGDFFTVKRRLDSRQRYQLSDWQHGELCLEQFPPYGTTCKRAWFVEGMQGIFRIIDAWPREWLSSERALRVASGLPDPLDAPPYCN